MSRLLRVSPRLPVRDLGRATAFWTGVMGFVSGDPWPAEDPSFVIVSRDGVDLQFERAEPGVATGAATLSFDVEDATALHAVLAERSAIEWGPEVYWYGRREFALRDPDGHLVILSEETADPPTCAG